MPGRKNQSLLAAQELSKVKDRLKEKRDKSKIKNEAGSKLYNDPMGFTSSTLSTRSF